MAPHAAEPRERPFRIAAFPPGVTQQGNPYFSLCHAALAKHDVAVSDDLEIDVRWLDARSSELDAVHLHWPERFWRRGEFATVSRAQRAALAFDRLLQLTRFLRAARRRGIRCLWTVHNLEPHEGAYRWDRYGYRLVARECDFVICHSDSAADAVRSRYRPRGRLVVMPIGDPASAYPPPRPRREVLAALSLDPDRPVVCCLGRLRDYKGLDLACAAIERLNGQVQLVIGGPRQGGFDTARLAAATDALVVIDRSLSDQEFADVTAASDAVLLPYVAITGSSALMAALGLGRGVIASELPYFQEILAAEPEAGVLVSGRDPDDWAHGILQFLQRPASARNRAALRLAARYSWDRAVEPLVSALGISSRTGAFRAMAGAAW